MKTNLIIYGQFQIKSCNYPFVFFLFFQANLKLDFWNVVDKHEDAIILFTRSIKSNNNECRIKATKRNFCPVSIFEFYICFMF